MSDKQSLLAAFRSIGHPRILVLGDVMLDRYTWGNAPRVSPEAPVLVLEADREEVRLGGAASVAALLRGLEAEVTLAGMLGDDYGERIALKLMTEAGIDFHLVLTDEARPTTMKERFVGRAANRHPHQILRVDRESRSPIEKSVEEQLAAEIAAELSNYQAVLLSDYGKGVCTPRLLQSVIQAASARNIPVLVDPARGASYDRYRGASVVKPNRVEAAQAACREIDSPPDALAAGSWLCEQFGYDAAVVTLDQEGMALCIPAPPGRGQGEGVSRVFPTNRREVYDITGAGDMALAMLGLCQASKIELTTSVELANLAAGLEVERLGVEAISRREVIAEISKEPVGTSTETWSDVGKLVSPGDLPRLALEHRRAGRIIVFTNGCFDLLHIGHVTYLEQAATLGHVLVVGINSDESVRRLKGPTRPIIGQTDRAAMLAALACVQHVVIFDENTPHALLRALRPDVLVKGGTYTKREVVGREVVDAYGGRVCVVGRIDGVSTTKILSVLTAHQGITV